jgi:hypothetical protein
MLGSSASSSWISAPVVRLAAVAVAVDRDHHLGRDLAETIEYRDMRPMSGEQADQIAPRLATARKATAVSGMLGR